MTENTTVPTVTEVPRAPSLLSGAPTQELVDCEHAARSSLPHAVSCGLGLYGGSPHLAICRTCQWREPRGNRCAPVTEQAASEHVGDEPPGEAYDTSHPAPTVSGTERLLLRCHLSPGDILMLTAAVRDLHRAFPGRYITAVETSAPELWENNPLIWTHGRAQRTWREIEMQYPLIHQSNQRPVHFLQGYADFLGSELGVPIPITAFRGDIYLTTAEKEWMNQVHERFNYSGRFWILIAGGKHDITAKWWPPAYFQQVVDHFMGRIQFVQCGQADHWHPPLRGVFNLVGQTSIRQFIRLMFHADGVVCPVTFAMHLAAAVPTKDSRSRPCVVIAGGREPPHWEAYPAHQFLHTVGCLPCCATGGCWRGRCQKVGDGDLNDTQNLCERPVQLDPILRIPQCMVMIQPQDVIRAIEKTLSYAT